MTATGPDPTNATLSERHDLNEALSIVRVRPDSGRPPDFEPGQFITLGLPRTSGDAPSRRPRQPGRVPLTRRAYSIASGRPETDALELFVALVEEGKLTPRLWTLQVGDRLWMDSACKGGFTLASVPADRDLLMVATGTGLAPYVSMLRTHRGQRRWRRFIVIHGVRRVSDLGYRAELEAAARTDPSVHYVPIVSRAAANEWPGARGRVTALLDERWYAEHVGGVLDPGRCHVFLCGNPAMIDEMEAGLQQRGFRTHTPEAPGDIHLERYW